MRNGTHSTAGTPVLPRPVIRARRNARRAAAGGDPSGPLRIAGLAVADSKQAVSQDEVLARLGLAQDEFARSIFNRSGVKRRHLRLDHEFLDLGLQGRTSLIERQLLERSVAAIDSLGVDPREAGTVLTASLFSLGGPTLAHRLIEHYGMDPSTDKYHLVGVGCASAVPLMRLATQALRAEPSRPVLVVAAECMSGILSRARPDDHRAKTVGAAIFGDGCAAAALSADPAAGGPAILASEVHQIPDTLDAVSLECSDADAYLHLARELPALAGAGLDEIVARFLRHNHVERSQIDHWMLHPGGRRIVENVQSTLSLSDEQAELSWHALAEHGNVGTPSIMYVLAETLARREPRPGEHGLMVTVGPGVTVGLMLLGW